MPYIICFLLASLLAVLPTALMFDMATPLQKWEYWYWPGQPHPVPKFGFPDRIPRLLRAEEWLFKVLVTPPALAAKLLGFYPGDYGLTFVSPGSSSEAFASLPPAALALEHLRRAFPFWLALWLLVYESSAMLRRRLRRVRVA